MKKITKYIIPVFLIIFLINPAFGYPGMTANKSTEQPDMSTDLSNTTESDQDIVLVQSLIEVDAVQLQSKNKLFVRETLIFKNQGIKNFFGSLRIWVPDGVEIVRQQGSGDVVRQDVVQRRYMMNGTLEYPLQPVQNGNIISWKDKIDKVGLPPIYIVEYTLPAEPKGTFTKTKHYSKMLRYPTLITKKPDIFVLKIIKNEDETVTFTDEKGNSIPASENPDDKGRYTWELPGFEELNVEISKPAAPPAGIEGYAVLGILILLVISYPLIRKKSGKIQALEEKLRNSLRREETEDAGEEAEETGEEEIEEPTSTIETGEVAPAGGTEFEGKTRDELENLKNEMLSKLSGLDKEYKSGNLLDEEYEELRKSYQDKAERITKRIEQL